MCERERAHIPFERGLRSISHMEISLLCRKCRKIRISKAIDIKNSPATYIFHWDWGKEPEACTRSKCIVIFTTLSFVKSLILQDWMHVACTTHIHTERDNPCLFSFAKIRNKVGFIDSNFNIKSYVRFQMNSNLFSPFDILFSTERNVRLLACEWWWCRLKRTCFWH